MMKRDTIIRINALAKRVDQSQWLTFAVFPFFLWEFLSSLIERRALLALWHDDRISWSVILLIISSIVTISALSCDYLMGLVLNILQTENED